MTKSSDYWQNRFENLERMIKNDAAEDLKEIEKQYALALTKVQKDLNYWYQRLADNNGEITIVEARKLLVKDELKEFKWTLEEYIKHGRENAVDKRWIKELENASAKAHIDRLTAIKLQTRQHIEELFAGRDITLEKNLKNAYEKAYYHTGYEIAKGTGIVTNLSKLDDDLIGKVIKKPWAPDGADFSSRIWKDKTKLINELHNEITKVCVTGSSVDDAIKNIAKRMDVSKKNAKRLFITELTAAQTKASCDNMLELDVTEYEYLATLDMKTSEICQRLDKKRFPLSEMQIGLNAPPMHPHCRSCVAPYVPFNEDEEGISRSARNVETGKSELVKDMDYKEWRENYVKEDLKEDAKDDKLKIKVEDVLELTKLKNAEIKRFSNASELNQFFDSNEEYQSWIKSIDVENKEALEAYTSDSYKNINNYNRKLGDWAVDGKYGSIIVEAEEFMKTAPHVVREEGESFGAFIKRRSSLIPPDYTHAVNVKKSAIKYNAQLDDVLQKYELKDNIKTYRVVSHDALPSFDKLEDLIGKIYNDLSYMSTAPILDSNFMKISDMNYILEITVPKGKGNGAYLEKFTSMKGEFEFLLPRNRKCIITEVRKEGERNFILMEMLP